MVYTTGGMTPPRPCATSCHIGGGRSVTVMTDRDDEM
jgi:hypothetical protein